MTEAKKLEVRVKRVRPQAELPRYQTPGAAGMDLHACVDEVVTILPGSRAMVGTGLAFAIPNGWEGQIRPRSGLAAKHGVTVINTPGTIDSDFRGEVGVVLVNHGDETFIVNNGERIAQIVFAEHGRATLVDATELDETERGAGGYGSTGR
jgi:dUTP pyrophosphatase